VSGRTAARLAWAGWALHVAMSVGVLLLAADTPRASSRTTTDSDTLNAVVAMLFVSWSTTGAIIASRRPRNPVGWLLLVVALAAGSEDVAGAYALWAHQTGGGSSGVAAHVAVIADALWIPSLVCSATLVPLLFPDGHLPSRSWRPVAWAAVAAAAVSVPVTIVTPGPLYYLPQVTNPLGVDVLGGVVAVVQPATTVLAFACCLAALVGLVRRYRRARGALRTQLRWFLAALVALAISVPPAAAFSDTLVGSVVFEVFWALPPIAIGIAVLRYRLYEIDRIISRTVTYAGVSAVLLVIYTTLVTLPSALFEFDSDVLVAGATLAAAAVFVPVRRRVQAVVDRRFNRIHYDARRVVERFGARLQHDQGIDVMAGDLQVAVAATVQPAHVALWIRRQPEVR